MKKFILTTLILVMCVSCAFGETVWVLCDPDSYVNIRPFASKKEDPCGIMECGWSAETNNKSKNGFIYLSEVAIEQGSGWIKKGYVVYSEPVIYTYRANVYSKGRVACFRAINGKRRCWVNNGDTITVYATSEEWSVTNKGYIKTKYIGVDYDDLWERMATGKTNAKSAALH